MNFQQKFCKRKIPAIECANIVRDPLAACRLPLSAFRFPLSALRSPLAAFRLPLAACRLPLAAFCFLLSAFTRERAPRVLRPTKNQERP